MSKTGAGPSVIAFAGHMLDAPGRLKPRFPAEAIPAVASAIERYLDEAGAIAAVSSLASGADILFAEAFCGRGLPLHVVLPIGVEEFVEESVEHEADVTRADRTGADRTGADRTGAKGSWVERFHRVRDAAASCQVYGGKYLQGTGTPFHMATLLIDGWARHFAAECKSEQRSLAVWDGRPGDGFGGTASFVGHAVMQGRPTMCISPKDGSYFEPGVDAIRAAAKHSWARVDVGEQQMEHRLCAVLFADAKGFSLLTEPQVPVFISAVLGAVRRAVAKSGPPPRVLNTWGDGLFAVLDDLGQAARLGELLIEESAKLHCGELGLTQPIVFRVGLHAGPCFTGLDPVTGRSNAYGADISLAARIEPVTVPGKVYCSGSFVGLALATSSANIVFNSLGKVPLAKGAGEIELWELIKSG